MFNKYPYTDFHELNLDWFLNQFKELVSDWEEFHSTVSAEWTAVQQEWTDTKEAWQTLYNYVHDYFDNLDVQAEIDHKLDEMVADGTMDALVQPYITAYANDLRVLEARMDTFASLPDGSTAGDAELLDIRVGANGITYPSAGDAVRGQIDNVAVSIDNLPFERYNANNVTDDYYLDSIGTEMAQVGWSLSDYLKICETATYYIPSATTSSAVFCWFYDETKSLLSSFQTTVGGQNTLTAPDGAAYVRFSIKTTETASFTYESQILIPYETGAVIPKLIENNNMVSSYVNDAYVGYAYSSSGAVNYSANWALLPLYKVNEGDVFYMDYPYSQYLTCFDANKQFMSTQIAPADGVPVTFVIPSGVGYIGVNLLKSRLGTYIITLNGNPLGAQYKPLWLRDSIWKNKSYISHGDSITWQDGEEYIQGEHIGEVAKGYQTVFADNVNLGRKVNRGQSGWSMAVVNGNGIVNTIIGIFQYNQFDLCTIACGTNDFKLNVPLGSLGQIGDTSFDDTTFYGAFRKAIEYILNNSPTIRLILMTPLQRNNAGYDVNYTNSAGYKLIDYVNAVKAVGEMYGLPVCDMYANSGFTQLTLSTYTMDGLHPNDVGYKRMGDYLTGFLNSIGN